MVSPELKELWLSKVKEAKPINFYFSKKYIISLIMYIVAPLVSIFYCFYLIYISNNKQRYGFIILFTFLFITTILGVIQVRIMKFSSIFVIIVGSIAIVRVVNYFLLSKNAKRLFLILFATFSFSSFTHGATTYLVSSILSNKNIIKTNVINITPDSCYSYKQIKRLNALNNGIIMAKGGLGAYILLYTKHSVIGVPFHRNESGILDTIKFFKYTTHQSLKIAIKRKVNYVVICDRIISNFKTDKYPIWMKPILTNNNDSIKIFKIVK